MQRTVLDRLFSNVPDSNEFTHHTVYPLWNGHAILPPAFMGKAFPTAHNHYIVSGNAQIDSGDLEDAEKHVLEHGYGNRPGSQLLCLMNAAEAELVAGWRAGKESRPSGPLARYDFIPSSIVPPFLTDQTVVGKTPPPDLQGVPVLGSYGHSLILESYLIPEGYFTVVASGGPNSADNPIALRQHANVAYRGCG